MAQPAGSCDRALRLGRTRCRRAELPARCPAVATERLAVRTDLLPGGRSRDALRDGSGRRERIRRLRHRRHAACAPHGLRGDRERELRHGVRTRLRIGAAACRAVCGSCQRRDHGRPGFHCTAECRRDALAAGHAAAYGCEADRRAQPARDVTADLLRLHGRLRYP